MKLISSIYLMTMLVTNVLSQSINNVKALQLGNNIEVTYSVSGVSDNQPYNIQVSNTNKETGAIQNLSHVYGEVGQSV